MMFHWTISKLQAASRDTVLRVLVVLVSISVLLNSVSIAGVVIERSQRRQADYVSAIDRNELRARARLVECFIVGVLDPLVARQRAEGLPVSPDLIQGLTRLRRPASVVDAATQSCKPFRPVP